MSERSIQRSRSSAIDPPDDPPGATTPGSERVDIRSNESETASILRRENRLADRVTAVPAVIETDGGRTDEDVPPLTTYNDDELGYTVAYPVGWSVERDPSGTTAFEATESSGAGAAVFVERNGPAVASAAAFLDDLDADETLHELDVLAQRDTTVDTGRIARVVECAYTDDGHDGWRLSYLFVRADGVSYTAGVDWSDDGFEATANAILESFALGAK